LLEVAPVALSVAFLVAALPVTLLEVALLEVALLGDAFLEVALLEVPALSVALMEVPLREVALLQVAALSVALRLDRRGLPRGRLLGGQRRKLGTRVRNEEPQPEQHRGAELESNQRHRSNSCDRRVPPSLSGLGGASYLSFPARRRFHT